VCYGLLADPRRVPVISQPTTASDQQQASQVTCSLLSADQPTTP
jgi:hypothetical protein